MAEKKISLITSAYRCEARLDIYFENIASLTNFSEIQLILVLNDPTSKELEICEAWRQKNSDNIMIIETPRESIGASTNRGYRLARTDFVAYADVDDCKAGDCYERQLRTLLNDPEAGFTYGDYVVVERQGETSGRLVVTEEFDKNEFVRSSHVGPNHFFRRSLLERCGYWDEQLLSGGDFDFQIRAAMNTRFKKTEGVLTYYTSAPGSGSAGSSRYQPIERTVIELRYGAYDKIDFGFLPEAVKYQIGKIAFNGSFYDVADFVPDYIDFMQERLLLIDKGISQNFFRRYKKLLKCV